MSNKKNPDNQEFPSTIPTVTQEWGVKETKNNEITNNLNINTDTGIVFGDLPIFTPLDQVNNSQVDNY